MEFLRYVFILFKFEKVLSFDEEETGTIAKIWRRIKMFG
jgi:hypothetical protein